MAIFIEGYFILAMLAREHGIEGLFDSFTPLRLRPNCFVIVDDPVGITSGASAITDYLAGNLALRINAKVNAAQRHLRRKMRFGRVVFFRRKIGGDLERKNSAIVIMPQDCVIGSADWTADQFCRGRDLPMREVERLGIVKFQRSRKIDREIIAQLVLRERSAITIGNLAARSGDIANVSAREFLCLECRDNLFVDGGRRLLCRCRGAGRYSRCRCQLLPPWAGECKSE